MVNEEEKLDDDYEVNERIKNRIKNVVKNSICL